ncbi:hypothetical protein ACWEQ5_33925 [Streptomyces griseoincarnatus]
MTRSSQGIKPPSDPERFNPLEDLPSVRLPDLAELRARGVLGPRTARTPAARRTLGAGGYPDTEPADTPG